MRLVITGMGAISSVGLDARGTAAAVRADLARPVPLDFDGPSSSGHPVLDFAEGFTAAGAWIRLGLGALREALREAALAGGADAGRRTGLWTVGPLPDPDRFEGDGDLSAEYLRGVVAGLGSGLTPSVQEAIAGGHVGLAAALRRAGEELDRGALERAIVVASDSLVEPSGVEWLFSCARLKTDEQPTGAAPGQAGTALVLETESAARRRRAPVLGFVDAVGEASASATGGDDDGWRPPDAPSLGKALASALRSITPPQGFGAFDVVLDLNGETWRSAAWGYAQTLLPGLAFGAARARLPAASLGDTGAAAAALGIQLAVHLFARGAGAPTALVCSIGDDARASAVRVSAPG